MSSLDAQATTRPAYEIDTKIEGENNIINIKLHANPKNVIVRNQLSLLFKRLKYNKKRIFDNGQVNTILDNMYAIYSHYVKEQEERKKIKDTDSSYNILKNKEFNNDLYKESDFVNNNTFIIKALVDKSPKIYTFVIDIDNPQDFVKPNVNVKSDKDIKKEIPDEVKQQIEKAKYESLIY